MKIVLLTFLIILLLNKESRCQFAMDQSSATIPISLDYKNGISGTGFILDDSPFVYIISAKHMVFQAIGNTNKFTSLLIGDSLDFTTYSKRLTSERINIVDIDMKGLFRKGYIVSDTINDIVAILIGKLDEKGITVNYDEFVGRNHQTKGLTLVKKGDLGGFDDITLGNDVFVFGFPKSIGLGLGQFELNKPLLCKGIIAGENTLRRTLILNAQIYHGNSGGPVFCFISKFRNYKLVGIVSQLIPYESQVFKNGHQIDSVVVLSNSNYSIVTPIDHLIPILDKFNLVIKWDN